MPGPSPQTFFTTTITLTSSTLFLCSRLCRLGDLVLIFLEYGWTLLTNNTLIYIVCWSEQSKLAMALGARIATRAVRASLSECGGFLELSGL